MISDLERYVIEMLVGLNNYIYEIVDYDKRKSSIDIYNKIFLGIPDEMKKKMILERPVPMRIDSDVVIGIYMTPHEEHPQKKNVDTKRNKIKLFINWFKRS